jgi:hypothetical protein
MNKIFAIVLLLLSSAAVAQANQCQAALTQVYDCAVSGGFGMLSFDWASIWMFLGVFLVAASIFLRLMAEGLGFIADRTKNTWDNKVVHFLMDVVNFLAKIIGWFGAGKTRLVK